MSVPVLYELRRLHTHMAEFSVPWEMSIAHTVPRNAQFTSIGDACGIGGGAFCHELQYWFDIVWSARTQQYFVAGKIHINILEFIVVLVQLAAAISRCEQHGSEFAMPPLSKLLLRTDNSPSRNWAHKISAKSERGQLFVSIYYAALLERTELFTYD